MTQEASLHFYSIFFFTTYEIPFNEGKQMATLKSVLSLRFAIQAVFGVANIPFFMYDH